jgi:hypothetical protein
MVHDVPFKCVAHLARNPSKRKVDPVCKTCIGNAMSARLDTLGARKVGAGCLEPGCEEFWNHDFIMRYMPAGEPLEKFNIEMLEVWKETADPKPLACLSSGCNSIGLPDQTVAGYPQVACNECSFRSCAQCQVPWHKDITCAEYAAKDVDEKMSDPEKDTLKLMQSRDGKRCPNCQLVIEKDGGCDSMVRLPYVLAEHDSQLTPYLVLCRLPQVLQLGQRRLSNNRRQETRSTIPPQHALLAERRTSDLRDGRYSGTRRHGDG